MRHIILSSLVVCTLITTGCTPKSTEIKESINKNKEAEIAKNIDRVSVPKEKSHVFIEQKAWIPTVTKKISKTSSWKKGETSIGMSRNFNDIGDFAGRVTALTDVKVILAPELVYNPLDSTSTTSGASFPTSSSAVSSGINAANSLEPLIRVDYNGNLKGLLDVVTSQAGLYWTLINENTVKIEKFETKTWRISALIGDFTQKNSVVNGNSTSSFDVTGSSIWTSFNDGVKSMLSDDGKVFVSESLGTITVTDTPSIIEKVDSFVKKQNKSLGKTVSVNLKIYTVKLNSSDDYGIGWDAIYKTLSTANTGAAISLSKTLTPVLGGSQLSLGVIGSSSELNGSKMLLQALSKRGTVSQVRDTRQLTLNGQPVPFKQGKEIAYLKSSDTTISNGIATTTSTQGVVSTGFFLNVVPHVLDDSKQLLLQIALNISTLDRLNSVSSGTSTIQTPETSSREMMQRVKLNSGDTLVITGFSANDVSTALGGTGSADNTWLGGSSNGSDEKTLMVVMVQPIVGSN